MATIDSSHQPPSESQIAPNGTGAGVVYWTRTDTGLSISQADGKSVQTWNVAPGSGAVQSSLAPTIATQGDLIWIAADGSLARLDTSSNVTASVELPVPGDNSSVEALRPSGVHGVHDIRSLAVDSSGHVAIALSAATGVLIYDDVSKSFSTVQLPANTDAWALAYFADGTLAIGASDNQQAVNTLLFASPDGTIQHSFTIPDASRLVTLASGKELLAGTLGPAIIAEDGTATPLSLPAGVSPNQTLGGVTPLTDGSFAVATATSVLVVHPDDTVSMAYQYPPGHCGAPFGLPVAPDSTATTTTQAPAPCVEVPDAIQSDYLGNIWMANPKSEAKGTSPTIDIDRLQLAAN